MARGFVRAGAEVVGTGNPAQDAQDYWGQAPTLFLTWALAWAQVGGIWITSDLDNWKINSTQILLFYFFFF